MQEKNKYPNANQAMIERFMADCELGNRLKIEALSKGTTKERKRQLLWQRSDLEKKLFTDFPDACMILPAEKIFFSRYMTWAGHDGKGNLILGIDGELK